MQRIKDLELEPTEWQEEVNQYGGVQRYRMIGADAYLANFDTLTEIYGRAVKNPALVPHWDELTAELVEGF